MDPIIIDHMKQCLAASEAQDVAALNAYYAPSFENIRMDRFGNVVRIGKDKFIENVHSWSGTDNALPPAGDVIFLDTVSYGDYCSLLMRLERQDYFILYHYVWHTAGGHYTIVREFIIEEDLSDVLRLLRPASN